MLTKKLCQGICQQYSPTIPAVNQGLTLPRTNSPLILRPWLRLLL